MSTSDEFFARACEVSPGGVHSPVRSFKGLGRAPIFFKSAQGARMTSVEGREYLDFCMSFGPLILGHRDPDVEREVLAMVGTAWTFGACEPYSLELAEWITEHTPWIEKLRFVSSGTEAVMSALRVARAATGRRKILKFEGCYHGHVDSLLVKAGSGLAGESASSSAGVPDDVADNTLVLTLDDAEAVQRLFAERGREIAAVIIEPLPANFGLLPQQNKFLSLLRELTQAHGALLIFDEVISGFRVALGGMTELTGILPDLVCYGKILGGGFPVGCYGGRRELMDQVAPLGPVYQAGTLSANPIGMRAGLATLKKMKEIKGWSILAERTRAFVEFLKDGFNRDGVALDVTSQNSLFWIHGKLDRPIRRIEDIPEGQSDVFKRLFTGCLERGIYLAPNAYEVGFLSMAHDAETLEKAAEGILEVARGLDS